MRLQQLTITDFGVYRGKVSFDLALQGKPIVIFGGKNGSGKTTLLEAVKLCLYGSRAFRRRFTRQEYEEYIRNRVHRHRGAVIPLNYTSVELKFNYSLIGEEHEYVVTRSWKVKTDTVQEQMHISMDGKPLSGIPEESWQEYIDDLVPPTVADLFFFDGEKIQSLVIDNFNQQTLANEVKRLLGLNIVERLQVDLETYLYRQRKENTLPDLQLKLNEAESVFQVADHKFQSKNHEKSQIENRLANTEGHVEKINRQINIESSGYALKRDSYKSLLDRVDIEQEIIEKQIHELSAGLLPFALIPELCTQLKDQLLSEAILQQWQSSKNLVTPKIIDIQNTIRSGGFWTQVNGHLPVESRQFLIDQLLQMLNEILPAEDESQVKILLHQVSDVSRMQMITWIEESIREIPIKVKRLSNQISYFEHTRQELSVKLRNVPDDSILQPLVEEFNRLNQQSLEDKALLVQLEHEKNTLSNVREDAQRKVKMAFDNLKSGKRLEERLVLVEKTQIALQDFLLDMTKRRIGDLERLIVKHFNAIARKPDLVTRLEINPQTFEIQIYDIKGHQIPKDLLSAGEKQMFAISLLWALRDLSGKPFPVIIDTPLGRLDSDHRDNLVEKYFPNVSHQVILFSTDTEIDETYFNALDPYVSHSFYLDYDPSTGSTNIKKGYFWSRGENAAKSN